MKLGRYKHFKHGDLYDVIAVAKHHETKEVLVIYRACHGEQEIHARPIGEFGQNIMEHDRHGVLLGNTRIKRFTYIGPTPASVETTSVVDETTETG